MCERYFRWFGSRWQQTFVPAAFDPILWAKGKEEWNLEKRATYVETILQQLNGHQREWNCSFTSMVKSGQCYYGSDLTVDAKGFLPDRKDRPRNIFNPCKGLMGFMTAIQSILWEPIKIIQKGFVQGYSKEGMTDLFRSKVNESMAAICIDGSAFDSTQLS